jgi:hypothetical protein
LSDFCAVIVYFSLVLQLTYLGGEYGT